MNVKIVIDMNLSPDWVPALEAAGWTAIHWALVADPKASDRTIADWAQANGHVVLTHDLDFGTILALTHRKGPSVIQVRGQDVLPDQMGGLVIAAIRQHEDDLLAGAILVVEQRKNRVRILPI